jgi:hypothetical protein
VFISSVLGVNRSLPFLFIVICEEKKTLPFECFLHVSCHSIVLRDLMKDVTTKKKIEFAGKRDDSG